MKSALGFRIPLVLLVLVLALSAYAQITPIGDAYTTTATPTKNFGNSTLLDVQSGSQTTYIQFDLSSIPAGYTSSNIAKATLKLYVNAVTTAGSFNVDYINGSWSESAITANLAPALGTTIAASVPLSKTQVHDYILIDVTPAVGAWLDGTQANNGIALVGNSPINASFDSKESTTQSQPAELDIVFTSSGISGITTAAGSGLTGGGTSGTLNLTLANTCGNGQVLQWNGGAWVCANAGTGTVTAVTAGAGLTGGGASGNVTLNLDTTRVPLLSLPNVFTTTQSVLGALGVGTSAPGYLFEVATPTTSWAQMAMVTGGPDAALSLFNTGGHEYWLDSGSGTAGVGAGNFAIYDNTLGATRLVVTKNGLIGIGTTAPVAQLEVVGSAVPGVVQGAVLAYGYPSSADSGVSGWGTEVFGGNASGLAGTAGSGVYGAGGAAPLGGGTDGAGGYFVGGNSGGTGSSGDGITAVAGVSGNAYAGNFVGNVTITGWVGAAAKYFKIDHPLDPANKYLVHASIESSEMMNLYSGNVMLDGQGQAWVTVPDWFEALNGDFRYQLTAIGHAGPGLYIAQEISGGRFQIAGGSADTKVSWQVTGVRRDPYAKAHPLVVEEAKDTRTRGYYIHPELYGAPAEKQLEWARHPQAMKHSREGHKAPQLAKEGRALPRSR